MNTNGVARSVVSESPVSYVLADQLKGEIAGLTARLNDLQDALALIERANGGIPTPRDSEVREVLRGIPSKSDFIPPPAKVPTARTSPHKVQPLAAYRSLYEWMQATMTHMCQTQESVTAEELWGEMMKGSTRGGRGHMPAHSTFTNYLYWYSNGSGQARGTVLWKRVGRGQFQPA
jgi:hypothetical protein